VGEFGPPRGSGTPRGFGSPGPPDPPDCAGDAEAPLNFGTCISTKGDCQECASDVSNCG